MISRSILFALVSASITICCKTMQTTSRLPQLDTVHLWDDSPAIVLSSELLSLAENINLTQIATLAYAAAEHLDNRGPLPNPIRATCPISDYVMRSRCCTSTFSHHLPSMALCKSWNDDMFDTTFQKLSASQESEQILAFLPVLTKIEGKRNLRVTRQESFSNSSKAGLFLTTLKHIEHMTIAGEWDHQHFSLASKVFEIFSDLFRQAFKSGRAATYYNRAKHRWESCVVVSVEGLSDTRLGAYCGDVKAMVGENEIPERKPIQGWDTGVSMSETTDEEVVQKPELAQLTRSATCTEHEDKIEYVLDPDFENCLEYSRCPAMCCDSVYRYSSFCTGRSGYTTCW